MNLWILEIILSFLYQHISSGTFDRLLSMQNQILYISYFFAVPLKNYSLSIANQVKSTFQTIMTCFLKVKIVIKNLKFYQCLQFVLNLLQSMFIQNQNLTIQMRNQQNSDFSPLGSQHLSSIICSGQNPANLVCLNKNCIKYGFICSQESCQCFSQHKKCLHVSTKTIKQIILDKEVSLKQLEMMIDEKVDKLIDSISIFREKTIAKIKEGFSQFGLSNREKSFIQTLQNKNPKFFTGKQMWEIHMNLQKEQEVVNSLNQAQKDIKKSFLDLQNSAQMLFIEVQQSIEKLKLQSEHYLSKRNQRIFQNSRIFKGHEQQVKIQIFLGKLKIKSVELLYRASDNMFDIELFHLKCDNIPFTLTVCQTEFNKIVGGYTSIPWRTLEDWEEATDQTSCSFIFSLSNNDYFSLRQPSKAIIHRNDFYYGPQFGGGADLCIADKANINSNSFSRINSSYFNKNYQQYDKESYKKFSGSETEFFRIKEWEVWRIQFEQQE